MTDVKKYRKKPVEIEAMRLTPYRGVNEVNEVADWCGGEAEFVQPRYPKLDYWVIRIPTLEGVMTAYMWDYVIKGVQGEFYPCKPDIFKSTYEAVCHD